MDSQLATVLTSGSLNVQNGSQCTQISGSLAEVCLGPEGEETSPCTGPGNVQPCPVKIALTIRQDSLSINGKKPERGGTSKPVSQEKSKTGGFREPITVKTGVPILPREPIRIRIVAPPQCKRPIAGSTIRITKDLTLSSLKRPVVLTAGELIPDQNKNKTQTSVKIEPKIKEIAHPAESEWVKCRDAGKKEIYKERDACHDNTKYDITKTSPISIPDAVKILTKQKIKEEQEYLDENVPLFWEKIELNGSMLHDVRMPEQTEPLDLSLPKKRERRCGRLMDDLSGESSLIMEVDEYEGEGDRDIVEDDNEGEVIYTEDPQMSPPFLFDSSKDCITEDLLLIDDQGIPYTLSPDGHKLPQVDISKLEKIKCLDEDMHGLLLEEGHNVSQSLDNAQLDAPCDEPTAVSPPSSPSHQQEENPCGNSDPPQDGSPVMSQPSSALSLAGQPIQILANSTNTPILFLSSTPSSLPLSELSQAQTSAPMLLLFSPVASSSPNDQATTSTPIALLDPTTGQVSQLATSSSLGTPLSHPVIQLSPNNPPLILSGNTVLSSLSVQEANHALEADITSNHNPISPSESTSLGNKAIYPEDNEEKPLTTTALSFDATPPQGNDTEIKSPSSDTKPDLSDPKLENLPLNDHLYYNCAAAPPSSPPMGATKLEPLDPLDPLSPDWTPDGQASRKVLYCQLCPRVFFYLSDLERHAITHSQKKPHVCPQCGKAFKRSSHLQRHKHIHTGQRNFVCPICAKRFREAGELQRHQRVHTGEKPYQCTLCHTRFAERNTLRRHTKRKHPYHQAALEMLSEKKNGGGREASAVHEEESAEWYSSSVSHLDNSESETEA